MSIVDPPVKLMTAEEFEALPDDGIRRELIRGELREYRDEAIDVDGKGTLMTCRNRTHSTIEAKIAWILSSWLATRPIPRGVVCSGEAGFRLRGKKDSVVGIDVAYASAELVASASRETSYFNGPPVLAVEILSPFDKYGDVAHKVQLYLGVGTVVWVVDPDFRRVSVHRPGQAAVTLHDNDELPGEPELPGFRVRVAELFP